MHTHIKTQDASCGCARTGLRHTPCSDPILFLFALTQAKGSIEGHQKKGRARWTFGKKMTIWNPFKK